MKEFIDKLIERLEDLYQPCYLCREDRCAIDRAISIANELAEEYGKDTNVATNADKIRSMNDAELAQTLVQDIPCKICEYWSKEISSCNAPFSFVCTKGYAEALYLKWLQSEAE